MFLVTHGSLWIRGDSSPRSSRYESTKSMGDGEVFVEGVVFGERWEEVFECEFAIEHVDVSFRVGLGQLVHRCCC